MKPNPNGLINPELWVLELAGAGRRCVLFSHACHPVIVYGYAYDAISADFPGQCRRELHRRLGPNFHCQFFQSFAGNVRPRALADLAASVFRPATAKDLESVGNQLADDVIRVLGQPGTSLELRLAVAMTEFQAPLGQPPPAAHWDALAADQNAFQRDMAEYWLKRYRLGPPLARTISWPVGLIRLTDAHWIAWMAGEVFAEWLGRLRAWLGERQLMAWGYSNQSAGYLPTEDLLAEGGYEIDRAPAFVVNGPAALTPGFEQAAKTAFVELAGRLAGT